MEPSPKPWWRRLDVGERSDLVDKYGADLPPKSKVRLINRGSFESVDDLLAAVERSRRASRSVPKAAATRKRKWRERVRESTRSRCRDWDTEHAGDAAVRAGQPLALKQRARAAASQARSEGKLRPPFTDWAGRNKDGSNRYVHWCERCREPSPTIEMHHRDYERELEVTWLCLFCHAVVHLREMSPDAWKRTFVPRLAQNAVREWMRRPTAA